jgi:hypothetical protein
MQTKGWAFLQSLLNKFGHQLSSDAFQEMFLSDMSGEEARNVMSLEVTSNRPETVLQLPVVFLEAIHYSWLIPALKELPPFFQKRVLDLIPAPKQQRISESLGIKPTGGRYIKPVEKMLAATFYQKMGAIDVLPKEFLPDSSLKPLLDLSKDELVRLIDLLGIHDLAEEMRGIVDQKVIKLIYGCLSRHQHRHLYLCLHQQEKVTSPPLNLSGWNGNCKTLQRKLHVRGIIRLAKALSGQHHDFIWHITHKLDTGRAKVLREYIQNEAIPKVTAALQQQAIQTINYLDGKKN